MNKDKKLYKIENKLGTFYIVAETFDEAANELKARLDQADYGFFQYRDIPAIEHVATQSFYNNELKQSFSDSKPNLIISGSDPICQREFAEQMALKCEECEKLKHGYDQMAADLADANEQLLKMQAEAEKKQKAYDDYVANAGNAPLPPAPADSDPEDDTSTVDDNQPDQPDRDNRAPQQSVNVDWSRYKRKFRPGDIICRKDGTTQDPLTIDRVDTDYGYYICTNAQVISFPDQREYVLASKEAKED